MAGSDPPSWDEIRTLIDRVDEVCRESEMIRAQAERSRRRAAFWPDRRQSPRRHDQGVAHDRRRENRSTREGR
jgi:hypothetical protein